MNVIYNIVSLTSVKGLQNSYYIRLADQQSWYYWTFYLFIFIILLFSRLFFYYDMEPCGLMQINWLVDRI